MFMCGTCLRTVTGSREAFENIGGISERGWRSLRDVQFITLIIPLATACSGCENEKGCCVLGDVLDRAKSLPIRLSPEVKLFKDVARPQCGARSSRRMHPTDLKT